MKGLIYSIGVLLFLSSCKSSKSTCDAYSIYRIPYNDSIVVSQWHEHVYFGEGPHCIYVPKEIIYYRDTIELKVPIEFNFNTVRR